MLGWSVTELARRAGVSWRTIQRAEAAGGQIGMLEKIRDAIEAAGVDFIPASARSNGGGPGIRRRP